MVSQVINVIVNSKGAVTVARELDKIGNSARQTTTYLNGLRAIMAAALTFSGANQIIEVVDNFTVLQNRLRQVSDETATVGESWKRLMGIANDSYSTIDNTVNLYFRVVQAYQAWGESAESAYEFTDLFQKAAVLSGSSMQTTAQAVYQFSQALNKGKLDGDEFRSVLEGLPYVATLIQKELGVTRAELYEMSKNGEISVDRIKAAFENAADTIRNDWGNITPTIGMALIVLKNNWTDFLGEIQTSTGIFSAFAQLILLIANNFKILAIALSPVVVSLGFLAGRLGIGLVVLGLKDMFAAIRVGIPLIWSFNAAMLANPIGIVVAAVAALVAGIIYFRNEIGLTNENLLIFWNTLVSAFTAFLDFLEPVTTGITSVVGWFMEWSIVFVTISKLADITRADIVKMFNQVSGAVGSFVAYMKKTLGPLFEDLIATARNYGSVIMEIVSIFANLLAPVVEAALKAIMTAWEFIEPAFMKFKKLLSDIYDGWKIIATYITTNFIPVVKDAFEGWIMILQTVFRWINNIIDAIRSAIALLKQMAGLGGGGGVPGGAHNGAQFKAGEGFATGGAFKVGGTGAGRDTTPVAFRAERGERVTVETKKQQRANDNKPISSNVNVPVSIVNVFDPSMIPTAVEHTASGQRSVVNTIAANRDEILGILGVV